MIQSFSEIKNCRIIVDTNIIIDYLVNNLKTRRNGNVLRKLADNNNELYLSEITGLELLRNTEDQDTKRKYLEFLNFIPNISVNKTVLINAASLASDYRRICNGRKINNNGDLIIGGTIITLMLEEEQNKKPALLLTQERKEFCDPIWHVVAYNEVYNEKEPQKIQHNIYLLEANKEILSF